MRRPVARRRFRSCFLFIVATTVLMIMAYAFVFSANPYHLYCSSVITMAVPAARLGLRPVPHWVVVCLDHDVTPLEWADLPPDWRAIVLAKQRPPDCSVPGCLYLSDLPEFQLRAGRCHLSSTAKMAAYLYAMKNGAKTILIGQPDIPVRDWLQGFHLTSSMPGLVLTDSPGFNPEAHFGLCEGTLNKSLKYNVSHATHPFIQHRLPWPNSSKASPEDITYLSPVMIGKETYSPSALSDSLLLYDGFWALPFFSLFSEGKSGVEGKEADDAEHLEAEYSASLVVQRLMQELDANVAFVAPARAFGASSPQSEGPDLQQLPVRTTSQRNQSLKGLVEKNANRTLVQRAAKQEKAGKEGVHEDRSTKAVSDSPRKPDGLQPSTMRVTSTRKPQSSVAPATSTSAPSSSQTVQGSGSTPAITSESAGASARISNLLVFLRQWQCQTFETFYYCVQQLLIRIMDSFTSMEIVSSINDTLRQMADLGYVFPLRFVPNNISHTPLTSAFYAPLTGKEPWRRLEVLRSVCASLPDLLPSPSVISDVMLIVTFNYPSLYRNIDYLKALYRPYFRHMMFCGPNTTAFQLEAQQHVQGDGYLYVEGLSQGWHFMYECTLFAMAMNPHVQGYLQIGDDTLVNPWQLISLARDKVWLPSHRAKQNITSSEDKGWMWWNSKMGRKVLQKVFLELNSLVEKPQALATYTLARDILNTFYTNAKSTTEVYYRGTDFFYIPERNREKYIFLSKIYLKYRVMNEIALINLVLGMDLLEDIHFFAIDGSLWGNGDRGRYDKFYNSSLLFMHPFKVPQLKTPQGKNFFCNDYMRHYIKHLGRSL